jgi:DNA-binding XRE family transcriptional regulator
LKNLKLKSARAILDMSQEQLAEAVGVTRQTIGMIEAGKFNPSLQLCIAICKTLGRTLDDIFWEVGGINMKDERIEQTKNKIRSELAIIILYGVAISFLVKTLVFNMTIRETFTEYLIMIFFPLYQFIRMHMMKISIYSERGNKQSVKNLIIAIAVLMVVFIAFIFASMRKSAAYDWQSSVVFLFIFLALFVIIFFTTNKFNQYRGQKYEKEFDDDK